MSARYLLRFDDVCPTMKWGIWAEVEKRLIEYGIKPIVAVVPDNNDKNLDMGVFDGNFWDKVRSWAARGWTIGMHGYQHRYVTHNSGIVGINAYSEFAGLGYEEQLSKLNAAMAIFRRERVEPSVWVAPGHSFDKNTLRALKCVGISALNDGYSIWPYRDAHGMFWSPQQLWQFRGMPFGVWTVSFHVNAWSASAIPSFDVALRSFRGRIVDHPSVSARYGMRRRSLLDKLFGGCYGLMVRRRRTRRQSMIDAGG